MSKAHRGSGIRELKRRGRGKCPVTGKTGVKLLYEYELDGEKVMVSKAAKATLTNRKRAAEKAERQKAAAAAPSKSESEPAAAPASAPAEAESAKAEEAAKDSAVEPGDAESASDAGAEDSSES